MSGKKRTVIKVAGVSKSFGTRVVLDGIDLEVREGENVVILGLSGSGKSVLMKTIIGFLRPDRGLVEVLGRSWEEHDESSIQELRRSLGVVFQDAALLDSLTVEQNITLPLTLRDDFAITADEARQRARRYLAQVGLTGSDIERCPVELSGGMQKRVGVARALAMEPEIILYDEPTTGLDLTTGQQISELIAEVGRDNPCVSSFTITHDYLCAATIADRVLLLDRTAGRLREVLSAAAIERIRRGSSCDGESRAKIRASLEQLFLNDVSMQEEPRRGKATQPQLGAYTVGLLKNLVTTLGDLPVLFFQMGFPLRMRDFWVRLNDHGLLSLPLVLGAGFFIGMTATVQFYLGVKEGFGDFGILDQLPAIISGSLLRVLAPLLVGLLLVARVGSNVTAEIGSKRLLKQIDALESLAISPLRFLASPLVMALAVITPLVTLACAFAGVLGSCMVWVSFSQSVSSFWAVALTHVSPTDIPYVVLKSMVIGISVGLVAYREGALPKRSADEVAAAATRTVFVSSMLVIIFDLILSAAYSNLITA